MSKSKIIWVVLGSLVLVAGLVAGMMLVFQKQSMKDKAAPATSFSITPSSQNKAAGESFNFTVAMDTGANQIMGTEIVINFNPQIFQVNGLTKGSAIINFTEIGNNIDNSAGRIHHTAYTADPTKALTGSNLSVLSVSAQVKAGVSVGTYNFTFDASSVAAALREGQNVLTGTTLGSIIVSGATGQPTATPTATPTQIPGSTPTPTPTSGSAATPTPTPTLRPNSTATPTPTATPTNRVGGGSLPTSTPIHTTTPTLPPIPVSGTSLPSVIGVIVGAFAVIGSLLLAL